MKLDDKVLVLLAPDEEQPRAARFSQSDEKAVRKIAATKGYRIGRPKDDQATEIALRLVDGRTFNKTRELPLVNPETYQKLLEVLDIEELAPATPATPTTKGSIPDASGPSDPRKVQVGATILCEDGKGGGWWEAKATEVSPDGKVLVAAWKNAPKLAPFSVKRFGLLPPKG